MQDESSASDQSQAPLVEFEPGFTAFGNYLIIAQVGEGGMGVVYKATNILLDRTSALKVMPVDTFKSNEVVRFQNEARMLSRLEHTNIARLFDFGIGEGQRPYLSMEFVEGDTLQESIDKNGPLPLDLFFEVFIQICDGLAHAHEKGVVHRDVKTSNIMLSADDTGSLRAVLLDFGVAKMSSDDGSGHLTRAGAMIGSPLYVSPEQIVGESATVASDIYSLSCVMFCSLTGAPPFSADTVFETLSLHREGEVPIERLQDVDGIFPELCNLIEKGLSKAPMQRQKSVTEIAEKLIELSAQLPDTESGADFDEQQTGDRLVSHSATLTGIDSKGISDRAAEMLYETATSKIPVDSKEGKSKRTVLIVAGVSLIGFVFVGLVPLLNLIATESSRVESPKPITVPVIEDPNVRLNGHDPTLESFRRKTEKTVDKFMEGKTLMEPMALTSLNDADNVRKSLTPSISQLYTAIEEYEEVIKNRRVSGPVKTPDKIMARAYVGLYDCNLQLRRFDHLKDLERQILKYCPEGPIANSAFEYIEAAANSYMKRKKKVEALRCLDACSELLKRNQKINDYNAEMQIASLEVNVGSSYLSLEEFAKAAFWLESARARVEKVAPPNVLLMAALVRGGCAHRGLKNYKSAIQRFRAAEKVGTKLANREDRITYVGLNYYQWGTTLYEMEKYDEAESKILKGISAGNNNSKPGLKTMLQKIRSHSARRHSGERQKVAQ